METLIKKGTCIKIISKDGETARGWVTEKWKKYFYVSVNHNEQNYSLKFSYKGKGIKNNWKVNETI